MTVTVWGMGDGWTGMEKDKYGEAAVAPPDEGSDGRFYLIVPYVIIICLSVALERFYRGVIARSKR